MESFQVRSIRALMLVKFNAQQNAIAKYYLSEGSRQHLKGHLKIFIMAMCPDP